MYSLLLYIYILLSQFGLASLFGSKLSFGGYQLTAWIVYLIYMLSFLFTLFYVTRLSGKYKYKIFLLFYTLVLMVTYVYSYIQHKGVMGIISSSVYYALPILFFPTLVSIGANRKAVIKTICITSILGAFVTLLFMTGILGEYILQYEITTERSSLLVDGGLGLVAVSLAVYMIFYEKELLSDFYKYATMISGLIIVMGGQSRARIILLLLALFLSVLINVIFAKENRMAVFRVIIVLTVVIALAFALSENMRTIGEHILGRFSTMGTDSSSMFRVFERDIQMNAFYESPFFGCGWNGLKDVEVRDLWGHYNPVNNHNMYSSLLAYGGVLYTIPFIIWFMMLFFSELFKIGRYHTAKLNIILIIIVAVLSWSSAGFMKQSQIVSMIIVYVNIIERENIPRLMKQGRRIGKIKFGL